MHNFLRYLASEVWAVEPGKARQILAAIEARTVYGIEPEAHGTEARRGLAKKREKETRDRRGAVAVIPVRGAIANRASLMDAESMGLGTSAERIEQEVRAAVADDDVRAIVLDIDSPGGAAAGTPEAAETIYQARGTKPIIAQVHGLAASAAFWLAAAADELVASPSSQVGSVGVITVHEDVSKMLEEQGVKETVITSSNAPYKAIGNRFEPLSGKARTMLQDRADQYEAMFIKALAQYRGTTQRAVIDGYGGGMVYLAEAARTRGMIDRIGTMRDTLERLGAANSSGGRKGRKSTDIARKRLQLERAAG